jgi:predicted aspartyl protease
LKWKYSKDQTPFAPIVEVNLLGFPIVLAVDTGFAGGILIPFPLFQSLGLLSSLTLDSYYAVTPDSRRIQLETAVADVALSPSFNLQQVDIHSSPLLDKRILGRSFLQRFVTILDGIKGELTMRH